MDNVFVLLWGCLKAKEYYFLAVAFNLSSQHSLGYVHFYCQGHCSLSISYGYEEVCYFPHF